jgi:hypothetical protein
MRAAFLAVYLPLAASPALACQLIAGDVYDEVPSPGFVLAIAEVTDLTITKSSEAKSCFAVDYLRKDTLFGEVGPTFRAETCGTDGPIRLEDFELSANEIGFAKGATVLVGVVPADEGNASLRHAVPSCWGPLHLRLDLMGEIEREVLIADYRETLAKREVGVKP